MLLISTIRVFPVYETAQKVYFTASKFRYVVSTQKYPVKSVRAFCYSTIVSTKLHCILHKYETDFHDLNENYYF